MMFGMKTLSDIGEFLNTDIGELISRHGHDTENRHGNGNGNGNSNGKGISQYPINSPEAKKAIAYRYYNEILNDANLAVIDELMAEDFIFTIPTHPDPYHGPQGFKDLVNMLHGAFPDVHLKVEHLLIDGDTVVGHWIGSGTHTGGPLHTVKGDIPPSGKHFVIDGMSWLKIVDGKIVESLANEDTLGLLQQIGVIPTGPSMSSPDANKAIARRYLNDIVNGNDQDLIGELIAPEFVLHHPNWNRPVRGPEGLRHYLNLFHQAFPDICYSIDRDMGDKQMAAIRWQLKATHKGEFFGKPASGNSIQLQGIWVFRICQGQIVEIWINQNDLGLMEQLNAAAVPA